MASYGRDTDDVKAQRSKESTVVGKRTSKLSVQRLTFALATKRSVAKSFDRSWAHFLARI
jgi:hypothetical protein